MNILFISHSSHKGGSERSMLELLRGLNESVSCHVLLPESEIIEKDLKDLSVRYSIVPFRWWTMADKEKKQDVIDEIAKQSIAVTDLIREINPDIIYTNTSVVNIGAIAAKELGIPHIWHIREFGEKDHNLKFVLDEKERYKYIDVNSDFVIFNSKSVKEYYLKFSSFKNSQIVYNNVSVMDGYDIVDHFKFPDFFHVSIVGNINRGKGQLDAIMAIGELKKEEIDAELVVVGNVSDKEFAEKCKEYIEKEGLEDNIQIVGYKENAFPIMKQSDAVLVCSKGEAFGRVTVEGMLAEKPVIGANSSGTAEMIINGQNGLLYEPGNYVQLKEKIKFLIENVEKSKEIGRNGKRFATLEFSEEKYAGKIFEIIEDIKTKKAETHVSDRFLLSKVKVLEEIISRYKKELKERDEAIGQREMELHEIRTSLRWKIPNFFYKVYKKKIKIFLPKKIFRIINPVIAILSDLNNRIYIDEKVLVKWKEYFDALKKANKTKKIILFVDRGLPEFDKDAGSFIAFEYLKILSSLDYRVIFWPQDMKRNPRYEDFLKNENIDIVFDKISPSMFFKKFGKNIDIAMLSRPHAGFSFLKYIKKYSKAKVIYLGHDLHYLREKRANEINKEKFSYADTKSLEFSIMNKVDLSLFFSEKEIKIIREENSSIRTSVLPWIEYVHNNNDECEIVGRKRIVFLGGFSHMPNVDAVRWFIAEVYPVLKNKLNDFEISIIGSNAPDELKKMEDEHIKILGFVEEEDLEVIFKEARVFVAPLRFGAGFKGKIAKAIGLGVPVVTTSIGAEGIGLENGLTAFITDDPSVFADDIVFLFKDENKWKNISRNSKMMLKDKYSFENARKNMIEIINSI